MAVPKKRRVNSIFLNRGLVGLNLKKKTWSLLSKITLNSKINFYRFSFFSFLKNSNFYTTDGVSLFKKNKKGSLSKEAIKAACVNDPRFILIRENKKKAKLELLKKELKAKKELEKQLELLEKELKDKNANVKNVNNNEGNTNANKDENLNSTNSINTKDESPHNKNNSIGDKTKDIKKDIKKSNTLKKNPSLKEEKGGFKNNKKTNNLPQKAKPTKKKNVIKSSNESMDIFSYTVPTVLTIPITFPPKKIEPTRWKKPMIDIKRELRVLSPNFLCLNSLISNNIDKLKEGNKFLKNFIPQSLLSSDIDMGDEIKNKNNAYSLALINLNLRKKFNINNNINNIDKLEDTSNADKVEDMDIINELKNLEETIDLKNKKNKGTPLKKSIKNLILDFEKKTYRDHIGKNIKEARAHLQLDKRGIPQAWKLGFVHSKIFNNDNNFFLKKQYFNLWLRETDLEIEDKVSIIKNFSLPQLIKFMGTPFTWRSLKFRIFSDTGKIPFYFNNIPVVTRWNALMEEPKFKLFLNFPTNLRKPTGYLFKDVWALAKADPNEGYYIYCRYLQAKQTWKRKFRFPHNYFWFQSPFRRKFLGATLLTNLEAQTDSATPWLFSLLRDNRYPIWSSYTRFKIPKDPKQIGIMIKHTYKWGRSFTSYLKYWYNDNNVADLYSSNRTQYHIYKDLDYNRNYSGYRFRELMATNDTSKNIFKVKKLNWYPFKNVSETKNKTFFNFEKIQNLRIIDNSFISKVNRVTIAFTLLRDSFIRRWLVFSYYHALKSDLRTFIRIEIFADITHMPNFHKWFEVPLTRRKTAPYKNFSCAPICKQLYKRKKIYIKQRIKREKFIPFLQDRSTLWKKNPKKLNTFFINHIEKEKLRQIKISSILKSPFKFFKDLFFFKKKKSHRPTLIKKSLKQKILINEKNIKNFKNLKKVRNLNFFNTAHDRCIYKIGYRKLKNDVVKQFNK